MNLLKFENQITTFNNFLNLFTHYICARCFLFKNYGHHKGWINDCFQPKNEISKTFYENYFDDLEHGFFHGLSCCYIIYLLHGEHHSDFANVKSNIKLEKIFGSALLHDFLRCNGFAYEIHDRELINFFPNLLPETYVHANPPCEFSSSHFVKADRLELQRFADYKSWVDDRFYDVEAELNPELRDRIQFFYSRIRPVLLYFYSHRKDIFIRHGIEKIKKSSSLRESIYPSKGSYAEWVENPHVYPIEIDQIPFGVDEARFNDQISHCSNHDSTQLWGQIKGFMALNHFKSLGGKIVFSRERDHLHAISEINLENWVFLYQNIDKLTRKDRNYIQKKIKNNKEKLNVNIPSLVRSKSMESLANQRKKDKLDEYLSNEIRIIPQSTLRLFFTLNKLSYNRLLALNYSV
jgi:hypothetical protein